jgi:hypothetical protein
MLSSTELSAIYSVPSARKAGDADLGTDGLIILSVWAAMVVPFLGPQAACPAHFPHSRPTKLSFSLLLRSSA